MTREAKIGMLTGLGVIVLIGVLLSEYLGDAKEMLPPASAMANGGATGRMAELPIGSKYRQQILETSGVPETARADMPLSGLGGGEATRPVVLSVQGTPPIAYAAEPNTGRMEGSQMPSGPVVGQPVAPVAVGPAPMDPGVLSGPAGAPPTISVAAGNSGNIPPAGIPAAKDAPAKPAVAGTAYTIAAGDNLAKIAKKFYGQSKESDVKRIVSANPAMLKDVNSPLLAGKKLTIPDAPVASKAPPAPATVERATVERVTGAQEADPRKLAKILARTTEPVMIYLPGSLQQKPDAGNGGTMEIKADAPKLGNKATTDKAQPKKEAPKIYYVQNGDTLEKIAKKMSPSNTSAYVSKLKSLNAVKDPTDLHAGQKLRLPV